MISELILTATLYAPRLAGHRMSNGQPYNPQALTAAYNPVKLGTKLLVCGKSRCVRVTVTDRMRRNDLIDLSARAAKEIGMIGRAKVTIYK